MNKKVTALPVSKRGSTGELLKQLLQEHGAALRNFLRMRLGARTHEVDDVFQDVFAKLGCMENLAQRLPSDKGGCRSYLYTMANNLVVDAERRRQVQYRYLQRQVAMGERRLGAYDDSPELISLAQDEVEKLRAAVAGMKPVWRDAFILVRLKRWSYKAAAQYMGVTVKQVERYLASALKRIRQADIGHQSCVDSKDRRAR